MENRNKSTGERNPRRAATKTPLLLLLAALCLPLSAQKKKETGATDADTPLHLLQPDYKVPYGELSAKDIREDMRRILSFLEPATPARVVDKKTGHSVTDYGRMDANSVLQTGRFRLTSYEWGVTYSAMLAAAQATGDTLYRNYVTDRFQLFAATEPHFRRLLNNYGETDRQMTVMLKPAALDDAGAMCAAMIKAQLAGGKTDLRPLIDNYMNYIMYHQHRLGDGTFARNRPHRNTLWLDDMFMSIPAIAWMGKLTGEAKYHNEAARQVKQFTERMFDQQKGLYRHGWVEGVTSLPAFYWGRANGWAILTLTETLDALPRQHPAYDEILAQYRTHIRGIVACQSGEGFWHQLLDRNDSYHETSATALFVYCIARGIHKGWIDPVAFGPAAQLGWHAVSTKINARGEVEGTCVGTGMAFDPAFYYHRPVSASAAHGYGAVLWAGAEMIALLEARHPKMNDSALQYYSTPQTSSAPIFNASDKDPATGGSRIGEISPVVFTIGDSTMKNGNDNGNGGMWGWGSFFGRFFDNTRISVENHALGGRSSRTFYTEGLWDKVFQAIRPGDYLLIQFGHNDGGPLATGRARASLKGTGDESQTVIMERHGGPETVYTFGHYLRLYIRQAKARGAKVMVLSHTPGNSWEGDRVIRNDQTYGKWSEEIATQEGAAYIDMNNLLAGKYEAMGKEATATCFVDRVHTTFDGAVLSARTAAEAIARFADSDLKDYIVPETLDKPIRETEHQP